MQWGRPRCLTPTLGTALPFEIIIEVTHAHLIFKNQAVHKCIGQKNKRLPIINPLSLITLQ